MGRDSYLGGNTVVDVRSGWFTAVDDKAWRRRHLKTPKERQAHNLYTSLFGEIRMELGRCSPQERSRWIATMKHLYDERQVYFDVLDQIRSIEEREQIAYTFIEMLDETKQTLKEYRQDLVRRGKERPRKTRNVRKRRSKS